MTPTPKDETADVQVEQVDREAVQAFHRTMLGRLMSDVKSERPKLGDDEGDAGTLVQAFARHRIAALSDRAAEPKWYGDLTVGDMIANLRTMPADMPIHSAYHVIHDDGTATCYVKPPTVSRERVDGIEIKTGDESVPYSAVIWSHPREPDRAADPDHGRISPGHVCKHGISWPHPCEPCDRAAANFWVAAIYTEGERRTVPDRAAEREGEAGTVAFVQEWMMSGDHEPTKWDRDFAAAIDARATTLRTERDALSRRLEAVEGALREARDQFAFYAREHTAAGKHEKAATNQRFADLADAALATTGGADHG